MSERDELIASWDREFQTTRRVLRAYPAEQADFRPHERSYSATELGTTFVASHVSMTGKVLGTAREFSPATVPAPGNWAALLAAADQSHEEFMRTLRETRDEHLRSPISVPLRPGEMSDAPRGQVLWLALMDQIHHRGQLSVYVRLAGGKVPSIYGPSADEPWPEAASRVAPSAMAAAGA